jgi:hypothetical protein
MGSVLYRRASATRSLLIGIATLALASTLLAVPPSPQVATAGEDEPPVQYPFACTAQDHGLELIVDNQDGDGVEVRDGEGILLGYSRDCLAETRTWYYAVDQDGTRHVVREHDEGPLGSGIDGIEARMGPGASLAMTELTDGREVPYLIRHERGVIDRFIYSVSMLTSVDEVTEGGPDDPDRSAWNGRLLYQFQGGVGIGHSQGRYDNRGITGRPDRLAHGYAVIYSTATRTGDHYNLLLGGRTAVQVKDHFVATHGEPDYTVGIGASGGGIQQYVYAQNHPDLLDAAIPQASYPDMTTQTIHVGDCALLDRYMDLEADDLDLWANWDNRRLLQGLNSTEGVLGGTAEGLNDARQLLAGFGISLPLQTGSSECLEGWLGLLPLAMNPLFGSESNWHLLGDQVDAIERTHWDDVREAYGTDPETGFARVPWDNVGVQYGLRSLADGTLAPETFLDVNAKVGSWKGPHEMIAEGLPFHTDPMAEIARIAQDRGLPPDEVIAGLISGDIPIYELFDPWSARNANLSPDGGATPAPRTSGDLDAIRGAYRTGLVFTGDLPREIPMIDVRLYLEHVFDMHNTHQSFAVRQRLIDGQGHADNQVVWFLDADEEGDSPAEDDLMHAAFDTIAVWMANLAADPDRSVTDAAPDAGEDRCFEVDGTLIAGGDDVWAGILDDAADGTCTERFDLYSTSRIEAGAPITGDIYKCHTMSVDSAVVDGLYGTWAPDEDEFARLNEIFPDGVCDYDLPDVGDPTATVPDAPAVRQVGQGNLQIIGAASAEVEIRQDGEVVASGTTNRAGRLTLTGVEPGHYVVRQVVDGHVGLRTDPVEVTSIGAGRSVRVVD